MERCLGCLHDTQEGCVTCVPETEPTPALGLAVIVLAAFCALAPTEFGSHRDILSSRTCRSIAMVVREEWVQITARQMEAIGAAEVSTDVLDAWGRQIHLRRVRWKSGELGIVIASSGPDGVFGNIDDIKSIVRP